MFQVYNSDDVLVFGVHPGDPPSSVADFAEQTGVTYPLVADQGTRNMFAYPPGSNYPYPRDVVVGRDGTIRSIKNSFDVVEMTALIEQLVAEPTP